MLALLLMGALVGVRHALEADHVAAVAALTTRSASLGDRVKLAAAWGGGHAASLMVAGAALVLLGVSLPEPAARGFEALAGVVLVALGVDVLRRVRERRIHVHVHQHGDAAPHVHVHAHAGESAPHEHSPHHHEHPATPLPRALAVGTLHGLAGSGALVLLALPMLGSPVRALLYVATFAIGSIVGMVLFSLALSLPLVWWPRLLQASTGKIETALGVVTIALGGWMALQAAAF
ncbi:MAG TPA: urease accessory protein [Candidatus Binatia bacterium]